MGTARTALPGHPCIVHPKLRGVPLLSLRQPPVQYTKPIPDAGHPPEGHGHWEKRLPFCLRKKGGQTPPPTQEHTSPQEHACEFSSFEHTLGKMDVTSGLALL